MGLLNRINGFEGRVELGTRATAAIFLRWDLEKRREESGGQATWTLRAVLSYSKDSLMRHPKFRKRIFIKVDPGGVWHEVVPLEGVEPRIIEDRYIIEGATLCRADQTGRA